MLAVSAENASSQNLSTNRDRHLRSWTFAHTQIFNFGRKLRLDVMKYKTFNFAKLEMIRSDIINLNNFQEKLENGVEEGSLLSAAWLIRNLYDFIEWKFHFQLSRDAFLFVVVFYWIIVCSQLVVVHQTRFGWPFAIKVQVNLMGMNISRFLDRSTFH